MKFNKHLTLEGKHAIVSASKHQWIRYDDDKIKHMLNVYTAAQRGTELHTLAEKLIKMGVNLPSKNIALNRYVNDSIKYKMDTEVVLYYSENVFGTADAIKYDTDKKQLYIFDLKTGIGKTSIEQLEVYAALFCLEYMISPYDITMVLRIYQGVEVYEHSPDPYTIRSIMDKIIHIDKIITKLK